MLPSSLLAILIISVTMSIQSDVEILSIQAVEHYAKLHNLSEIDVVNLFHKHQVFEKIILQHEYLHQLDFSETVNYVEEIVNQDASDLVLYHGSNIAFDCIDYLSLTIEGTLDADFIVLF